MNNKTIELFGIYRLYFLTKLKFCLCALLGTLRSSPVISSFVRGRLAWVSLELFPTLGGKVKYKIQSKV